MPQIRTVTDHYQCWCVLIEDDRELPCLDNTSGPDDPFCDTCTDRHPYLGVEVGTRDPRQY